MQNDLNDAKQFSPFKALNGFEEMIKLVENDVNGYNSVKNKIKRLKVNDLVTIKYFYGYDFIETRGKIKEIDFKNKAISILDSKILDDVNYYFGLRLDDKEEPTNNYLFFEEIIEDNDTYLNPIDDENMKKILITAFTINYLDKVYDL